MPKFSVIIPVYNVAPYLRECLDSVLAAAGRLGVDGRCRCTEEVSPLVEIICVDDGSTDGSGEILNEYREKVEKVGGGGDERKVMGKGSDPLPERCSFRVIHQKNAGVSAARNAALEVATGEWICFVDADDAISPGFFSAVSDCVKYAPDAQLVAFEHWCFSDGGLACQAAESESFWRHKIDIGASLGYSVFWRNFWTYAYRRDVVPADDFPPYVIGEDLVFLVKALVKAKECVLTSAKVYGYRQRNGSAIRSPFDMRKFGDFLKYSLERLTVVARSNKAIATSIYRRIGIELTENAVGNVFRLRKEDRALAWRMWYEDLRLVNQYAQRFSRWRRLVIALNLWLPFHFVAILLCYLPFKLKVLGLHR